jgi:hypothetical protein
MIAPHKEGGVLTKLLMNFLRQVLNLPYPENDNILGYFSFLVMVSIFVIRIKFLRKDDSPY